MNGSRKKRGRKARYAVINGREIEGLYLTYNPDKSIRNYYYLDKNKRQISCTADPIEAARRYRKYKGENQTVELLSEPVPVEKQKYHKPEKYGNMYPLLQVETETVQITKLEDGTSFKQIVNSYTDETIIMKFVELLKKDPYRVAEISKMPQFAHMENITPLPKSITLDDLLDLIEKREDISHNYRKDIKNFWREFKNFVEVKEVRQINYEIIGKYNDQIHRDSKKENITNPKRYIGNRFNAVKAVIYYAKKRYEYKKDLDTLLSHLEQLQYITKFKSTKPKVLSKEEFKTMYKKAENPLTKCLLLLGLNCAMRYGDIISLKKTEIDFKEITLHRPRAKTGIIHSAILWNETIEALRLYMKEYPNKTEYVFISKFGNQYMEKYLRTLYFNPVRVNTITHKHLRNSLSSIANRFKASPNGIKICMGHNIGGVDNSYNERHPEATREVCKAVYDFYFG